MAKPQIQPLKIQLQDIPHDGESFVYNRDSGEMNNELKDLLENHNYHIEFTIKPIGNAYELRGKFSATTELICSRCAFDFQQELKEEISEILIVEEKLPRKGKLSKSSGDQWDLPNCIELEKPVFYVAKLVHELIALAIPTQPLGKENCDESCENYQNALKEGWLQKKQEGATEKESPFSILKKVKPKH